MAQRLPRASRASLAARGSRQPRGGWWVSFRGPVVGVLVVVAHERNEQGRNWKRGWAAGQI